MKNLRNATILLLIIFLVLLIASAVYAVTRGIHIVSKKGEDLYLYKDYHALVVGVSDYDKWPNIPNAVGDAKEISAALKGLGFTVKEVYNPASRELKTALNDLTYGQGREKNRAILFYFAGHGETETMADGTKLGYIIPSDCPL
ncbi:MAG: caspase family protein, partial [Deltaproteobacteria bacterium]|nr:caspase family protein [Deltaproteobacteria bacterium]